MKEILQGQIDISNVKRCYVDLKIKEICPQCKEEMIVSLRNNYLSYPVIDKKTKIEFYCENCDNDYSVSAIIKSAILTIEIDKSTLK